MSAPAPVLPRYGDACLTSVFDVVVQRREVLPDWAPRALVDAKQVVLLVLDGLGWEQLRERAALAPRLASMEGGPITSVAPTTTAAALTSISVGCAPAEHGVVGYRVSLPDLGVLNVLRWRIGKESAIDAATPEALQPFTPFGGRDVAVVTKSYFAGSGFTTAHLRGSRLFGWRQPSAIAVEVRGLLAAGEEIVYAYYDGVDHASHDHGLGDLYDAELAWTDRLVGDLCDLLPPGAALVVIADHGQIHVGENTAPLDPELRAACTHLSGEGRFLWLHARGGRREEVVEGARAGYGDVAWVVSRDEMAANGWMGRVSEPAAERLGDVAIVVHEPFAFVDPDEAPHEARLVGRHGSLTAAEMLVPFVGYRA